MQAIPTQTVIPLDEAVGLVNPLARLIAQRREEEEAAGGTLSYGDIARRSGLPRSTVYKLATQELWLRSPGHDTLDRLAHGLGMSVATVRAAASEAVGLHTSDHTSPEGMRVLIGSLEQLDDDQRAQVSALVRAMLAQQRTE